MSERDGAMETRKGEARADERPLRLHVGCGRSPIAGWTNLDIQALPGVDVVVDCARSLPFHDAEAVFAEHFLEHLRLDEGLAFLERAHRALGANGWLRLSTPNLDWVLASQYPDWAHGEQRALNAVALNRAFHGWGHQFAWNAEALELALRATGFEAIRRAAFGESELPFFRGIERHETYPDLPGVPHVLIYEARKGAAQPELLARVRETVRSELLAHLEPLPTEMATGDD